MNPNAHVLLQLISGPARQAVRLVVVYIRIYTMIYTPCMLVYITMPSSVSKPFGIGHALDVRRQAFGHCLLHVPFKGPFRHVLMGTPMSPQVEQQRPHKGLASAAQLQDSLATQSAAEGVALEQLVWEREQEERSPWKPPLERSPWGPPLEVSPWGPALELSQWGRARKTAS